MAEYKSNADIAPCLTAVMPVYNEAATVAEVVQVVLTQRPVQQLVVVDDGSADGTSDRVQPLAQNEPRIKLVRHEVNQGKVDVVFSSRFMGSEAHRVLYYWHSVGNKLLTTFSNMATDLNLTDLETRYKTFRREVIQKIRIEEDRFGFEPEITAKVARLKARMYEVAISYYGRTYAEGKKIGWRDDFRALWCIGKYNFRPGN